MNFIKMIVKRKVLILLAIVFIVIFGSYALLNLDKELTPEVGLDSASIEISAGDTSITDVEQTIITPLERDLQEIEGIETIKSTAATGGGSVQIIFDRGQGKELVKEVESMVHSSVAMLSEVESVHVTQGGSAAAYEFIMDVSGENIDEVSAFSENILKPRLEELPQVSEVTLDGITRHKVHILFDEEAMEQNSLEILHTIDFIRQANDEAVLGELTDNGETTYLQWNTAFHSIADLQNIQIPSETGDISLQAIADISLEPLETTSNVWKNGSKDFVLVQIARPSNVSQLEMTNAVRDQLAEIRKESSAESITLNEIVAHSDFVENSIGDVTKNILIGGMIAIAVLLLFLRNIRATIIVGLSIPASVLTTVIAVWLLDYSLNMLTLIGLGLGIGMMIDSSIVVFESIYAKKEKGLSNLQSVLEGTKEVAGAIIASILTTIAVFLPIGLVGGDVGRMMIILSMVVAISLISSLFIAFTFIPAMADKYMKLRKSKNKRKKPNRITNCYQTTLSWILNKKRRSFSVVILYFVLFVSSFLLVTKIPMSIMPDMFHRYTEIGVELENGISDEEKQDLAASINEELQMIHDVEANYVLDQGNTFITVVNMTEGDQIQQSQEKVSEEILRSLRALGEKEPIRNVQLALDGGSGYPIQINISGEEFETLETIADEVSKELETTDGVVEITNSLVNTSQMEEITLNKEEIDESGVGQWQIKEEIEKTLLQMPIGKIHIDNEEVEMYASLQQEMTEHTLLNREISTLDGMKPLSNFMDLENKQIPEQITHNQGERYISVLADIDGKDLGTINSEVQEIIDHYQAPDGYSVSVAGELEQQEDLMNDMVLAFVISLLLVYFIMAVQFNHLGHPLIVLFIIPITITGVILGLFITQKDLSVMSGIGVIMLVGIVLNNAILLIDRTNQLRRMGYSINDALLAAGRNRLRPIFITTLTTVGGMLPLALASGMSADYQAPLAIVIISGLLFATFITLILTPSIYKLVSKET